MDVRDERKDTFQLIIVKDEDGKEESYLKRESF